MPHRGYRVSIYSCHRSYRVCIHVTQKLLGVYVFMSKRGYRVFVHITGLYGVYSCHTEDIWCLFMSHRGYRVPVHATEAIECLLMSQRL